MKFFKQKYEKDEDIALAIIKLIAKLACHYKPPDYQCVYATDNIANKKIIIKQLSKMIAETIHSEQYHQLNDIQKNEIKCAIAEQLYTQSFNYETTFVEPGENNWDWRGVFFSGNGITFSLKCEKWPTYEAYELIFPENLFKNKEMMKSCIHAACMAFPDILLNYENISLALTNDL